MIRKSLFLLLILSMLIGCSSQSNVDNIDNIKYHNNDINTIGVAAIKLHYTEYSLEEVKSKIEILLNEHPDVELIVTPEYLFYGWGSENIDYRNDPIQVRCLSAVCTLASKGTSRSDELINNIYSIQQIAKNNKVNIVLGTVAESEIINNREFVFDTQLIINNEGEVIGKHRMYGTLYSKDIQCYQNRGLCESARMRSLDTAKIFRLENRKGIQFNILPHVCGEKADAKYIAKITGAEAAIIVGSDFDLDFPYEKVSKDIQKGLDPFVDEKSGAVLLRNIFLNQWLDKKAMLPNAYFLVANGYVPDVGLFRWNLEKIDEFELTADYIYGRIEV